MKSSQDTKNIEMKESKTDPCCQQKTSQLYDLENDSLALLLYIYLLLF